MQWQFGEQPKEEPKNTQNDASEINDTFFSKCMVSTGFCVLQILVRKIIIFFFFLVYGLLGNYELRSLASLCVSSSWSWLACVAPTPIVDILPDGSSMFNSNLEKIYIYSLRTLAWSLPKKKQENCNIVNNDD